jgi:type III secretion protein D
MLKRWSLVGTPVPEDAEAYRLEIVAGPRVGARTPVEAGRPLRIGHAFRNDVVIRHPSVGDTTALLSADTDGFLLQVDSGSVVLLGVPLEPGRVARLPAWIPFAVGEAVLAVGPDVEAGWAECRRLARQLLKDRVDPERLVTAVPRLDADDAQADVPDVEPEEPQATSQPEPSRWLRVPALLLIPGAFALIALGLWPTQSVDAPEAGAVVATQPEPLRTLLADEGLSHLKIQTAPNGGVVLQGLLDRDTDLARLSELLARASMSVRLDLGTGEQLARQVGDVLRLNGVEAQVRHVGRGVVEARFVDPGAVRRKQVEAAVRRDVPALAGLMIETSPPAEVVRKGAPVATDPGKRVTSVVYGPRGYVVTADGSRYFEGAFLPSGHRIAKISNDEVHLERDGASTRLAI